MRWSEGELWRLWLRSDYVRILQKSRPGGKMRSQYTLSLVRRYGLIGLLLCCSPLVQRPSFSSSDGHPKTKSGRNADLIRACKALDLQLVKLDLQMGADPNAREKIDRKE